MGRRCKNCDTAQTDKRLELCAACEIQFIKPSNDTDEEFAELFRHYHGQSKESLNEDIFGHERRLKLLANTAEDINAVAHLLEFHSIIEAKKKEILIKLLAKDVSNVSSSIEAHQPKEESFISSSPTPPTPTPRKIREEQPAKIERKIDINSNTIPCSYGKPILADIISSTDKNSSVLSQSFNTHDEIDGRILYKEDGNETGNKIVRRRSSVKDKIQAFENLHKRTSLGNSNNCK